ncbi:Hypothetical predicted protein [Scomber scombrus]|uniref:Uncharacterized protein n=1 Tax=Scomber scombrus TaxID=13677 RepID=A0AAV1Q7R0_SCOSC
MSIEPFDPHKNSLLLLLPDGDTNNSDYSYSYSRYMSEITEDATFSEKEKNKRKYSSDFKFRVQIKNEQRDIDLMFSLL